MAIRNLDILHTDMKCAEFHSELSTDEKQNLINKLESYVSVLHSEVRRDASLAELHKAVEKHHAEFGIKYTLSRDLPMKVLKGGPSHPEGGTLVSESTTGF